MPDGVEDSSLETATIEGMREDSLAETAIDETSELDEEKNESEIMNVNFGMFCQKYLTIERDIILYARETFSRKSSFLYKITLLQCFLFLSREINNTKFFVFVDGEFRLK